MLKFIQFSSTLFQLSALPSRRPGKLPLTRRNLDQNQAPSWPGNGGGGGEEKMEKKGEEDMQIHSTCRMVHLFRYSPKIKF